MEKRVNIGVAKYSFAWDAVLQQIGACWSLFPPIPSPGHYSLLIINRPLTADEYAGIQDYIRNGGAVIDEGFCIDRLLNGTIGKKRVGSCIADDLPFQPLQEIIDIYDEAATFSHAQYLNKTLGIHALGNGIISFLGLPLDRLLFDERSARKEFYSVLPRFPNEETSRVSKGEIFRLLFSLIRHLHICRNIPFVHKWFFPGRAVNVFLFRIDTDFATRQQIAAWHDIARKHGVALTWFLHVAAHEAWLDFFRDCPGHEAALHCYTHGICRQYRACRKDIDRSLAALRRTGISCTGYASPYGVWHRGIHRACEESGFRYSSEFSYLCDSLPLHPVVEGRKSALLQLPVHPVCIGSLRNAKADEKGMAEYLISRIRMMLSTHSPLIFYDHPTHQHTGVVEEVFSHIRELAVPSLTFAQYAAWWEKRERTVFSASVDPRGRVVIRSEEKHDDCAYAVWENDDSYVITGDGAVTPASSTARKVTPCPPVDSHLLARTRKWNWRVHKSTLLNRYLWRKYND